MGREIKRVPVDFDWPLNERWVGFINPHCKYAKDCPFCEGGGYNEDTQRISDDWYDFKKTGRKWCSNITQDEVDALVEAGRLTELAGRDPKTGGPVRHVTAEQVNAWNEKVGIGHDSISKHICVETRAKREGVYGLCEHCNGEGYIWRTEADRKASDEWEESEPPEGEGWQMWETVSEGSPITPVFATAEGLIEFLSTQKDAWGKGPVSRESAEAFVKSGWAPTMIAGGGVFKNGVDAASV